MTMQEKIRPGYKQTEVGVIPEDWEIVPFDDVFRKVPSKAYQIQTSEYRETGLFPVIDQGQKRIVGHSDREDRLFKVPAGGVIIFGDHTCIVKLVNHNFIVGADGTQILLPKAGHCAAFHNYGLQHRGVEATGYNRHFKFLKQRLFSRPPLREQTAIAEALSDADARIAALEALIAKKRDLKQAAMQQLLTGKTRLPGFSGEWEVKRLGEITSIKTGKRNNHDKMETGEFPFFVRSETVERIDSYSHDCEAILVPGEGNIGNIFHYINGKFDVHQRVYAITQFAENVSGKYVHLWMRMNFGAHAMQNTVKATVDSLRLPTFQNFQLLMPPTIDEQTAIAEILSDIDAELAALEAEAEKARTIKQGMMQNLLTGKVRLV